MDHQREKVRRWHRPARWVCVGWGVVLGGTQGVGAQDARGEVTVLRSRPTGEATFVVGSQRGIIPVNPSAGRLAVQPMDFLRQYGVLFGVTDPQTQLRMDVARTGVDALGYVHTTYTQVHKGVAVFSGVLKIHQEPKGRFLAANGDFYPIADKLNTKPDLSRDTAATLAAERLEDASAAVVFSQLVIVDPGWYGDPSRGAHLAYHLVLSDPAAHVREAFFVDAHDGAILDRWTVLDTARDRRVYDGRDHFSLPGTLARKEGDPRAVHPLPGVEKDVNRAYDYAGDTYDYYARAFGRDGIDDGGSALVLTVHSRALSCPNAAWNGSQTIFCIGAATDDVVAHEMTHGVTQFTANLIYQNQSGQLNESYSDIFGELVDLFNGDAAFAGSPGGTAWPIDADYTDNDLDVSNKRRANQCSFSPQHVDGVRWLVSEDAVAFGGSIRDMWLPGCFGDPDRALSLLQACGGSQENDNGGVHSGSGIPNHAFAMLVDGQFFNNQNIVGIGPIKAGAVWYRALTTYLTVASDFADAFTALNQSAADLVGTFPNDPRTGLPSGSMFTSADAANVNKALLAVEMNTSGRCGASVDVLNSVPPTLCSPRFAIFRDDFESGINGWAVTNSNPPTSYDWVQRSGLPFQRPGTAWYCADPSIGTCTLGDDESAIHSLFSPMIDLPMVVSEPTLAFTHYMASEPGWDGGNLQVSVNSGPWQAIPASAFTYNPYNTTINTAAEGNTNPLAGQGGFTGAGGGWGTSLVDLKPWVHAGDHVQFRFDFGKDGCGGVDGWYMDDFEVFDCVCSGSTQCDDGDDCTVDYCLAGTCNELILLSCSATVPSIPPNDAIDARQPHDRGTPTTVFGWNTVDVFLFGAGNLPPDVVTVTEHGGDGVAPVVTSVTPQSNSLVRITLDRPIEPGAWTMFSLQGTTARLCLGYLPGDVNGSGQSNASDITALIDSLNKVPGRTRPDYAADVNRSGVPTAQDITSLVDLLNGAASFRSWFGASIGPSPCDQP